ncbi:MAG: tetratricopeptide repeat protein, partial [Planktomarina sp.]
MFDFSSKFFCYLIAALLCGNVAVAQTTSGSYLAASSAQSQHDYAAAARYYVQTISNDPGNLRVMTQGMSAFLAAGDVDRALVIAKPISQSGQNIALAEFLLLAQDFRTGTFDAAFDRLNNNTIAGASIDQMLVGWALMGQGQVSDALMAFDEGAQVDGMRSFALYQKALALALVGDFEGAEAIFAGDLAAPVAATLRGSLARAQILAQLDRGADAADYLTQVHGENGDPQAMALRARLLAGAAVDFDIVQDASEGGGEVLFNIASALRGENGDDGLLFYVRLATYLAPQNVHA